jgi:hypothetical protein
VLASSQYVQRNPFRKNNGSTEFQQPRGLVAPRKAYGAYLRLIETSPTERCTQGSGGPVASRVPNRNPKSSRNLRVIQKFPNTIMFGVRWHRGC